MLDVVSLHQHPARFLQVMNRDRLQRAGSDNLLCRAIYPNEAAQQVSSLDEQEKLGELLQGPFLCEQLAASSHPASDTLSFICLPLSTACRPHVYPALGR